MQVANIILILAFVYLVGGIAFAIAFVARGAERIDPSAHGASIGFRLLILPGSAALWPVLLLKWIRS